MKKLKITLILFIVPMLCLAQLDEISLSYSPFSVYKLGHFVGQDLTETNHKVLGAINLDYYHYMNDWLKIGVSGMFDQEYAEGFVTDNPIHEYEKTNTVFVLAPQIDFEYIRKDKFRLSSGLGMGYAFSKQTATEGFNLSQGINGVTFHINLISFRLGNNNGLFGYMGLGYKGFLGLGYFIRL